MLHVRGLATRVAARMPGPVQQAMYTKITEALQPKHLQIVDDSKLHAGHAAMRGNTYAETHFRASIVSDAFIGKPLLARHRLVFDLVKEELTTGGLHALNLYTKTVAEAEKSGWEIPKGVEH